MRREYGFFAQRLLTFEYEGEDGANRMAAIMKTLRTGEGNKTDYLLDDTGLPKSDVIEFRQSDGNKWIVRPSGTEPKLKAYLFASAETRESAEKQLDVLEETVNAFCK